MKHVNPSEIEIQVEPITKTLIMARSRVERGWCQGIGFRRGDIQLECPIHAVWEASGGDPLFSGAVRSLNAVLPDGYKSTYHYNDVGTTTKADILALFDRAIAAARAAGA